MRPVFEFLHISVGYIKEPMGAAERRAMYSQDVTYVTAKEAGFDYLRSFLSYDQKDIPQRPFHFGIVDEADSILIDEGRIPLVIAEQHSHEEPRLRYLARIIRNLEPELDYAVDIDRRNVCLTEEGIDRMERELGLDNLFCNENSDTLRLVMDALHAEVLLKRDVDYLVQNGHIELVDEFTGRVVENRHWPAGLQEALEAKEGILSQKIGRITGSITMQNFIKAYPKIAGMTGTAQMAADELKEFYDLEVVMIPPHRPCIRVDEPDRVFTRYEIKMRAVVQEIEQIHRSGRPILIGTGSVRESEVLAERLREIGVLCRVLNAKNDEAEAEIIRIAHLPEED
jgi:preprotein translocase subunit SecA